MLIINSHKSIAQIRDEYGYQMRLALVDADRIAREELGLPITNTTMLGALVKGSGLVNLDSFLLPLKARFGRATERNEKALRRAFKETILSA